MCSTYPSVHLYFLLIYYLLLLLIICYSSFIDIFRLQVTALLQHPCEVLVRCMAMLCPKFQTVAVTATQSLTVTFTRFLPGPLLGPSTAPAQPKLLKVGVCPISPLPVLVASLSMLGSVAA